MGMGMGLFGWPGILGMPPPGMMGGFFGQQQQCGTAGMMPPGYAPGVGPHFPGVGAALHTSPPGHGFGGMPAHSYYGAQQLPQVRAV